MTITILPLRTIIIQSCWPYSGKKYQVLQGGRVLMETDNYGEAEKKAQGV